MSIKVGEAEWQGCDGEGKRQLALLLVVFNPRKNLYDLWSIINGGYWIFTIILSNAIKQFFCNKTEAKTFFSLCFEHNQ